MSIVLCLALFSGQITPYIFEHNFLIHILNVHYHLGVVRRRMKRSLVQSRSDDFAVPLKLSTPCARMTTRDF